MIFKSDKNTDSFNVNGAMDLGGTLKDVTGKLDIDGTYDNKNKSEEVRIQIKVK
jgi:hypothetical protein